MLIKDGAVAEDPFAELADDAADPGGAIIVSFQRFLKNAEALVARGAPVGVCLETADSPEALGANVHKLALIVLHIPHFKDGRAFSWARMLRTRLGFKGELRVSGHVLRDQIAFYGRVGVNAFALSQNLSLGDFNAALKEFTDVYQPSVDGRETINELRAER
nr:MAG: DUF934 domain-containing protein [Hyphomicrobiales bacterium]